MTSTRPDPDILQARLGQRVAAGLNEQAARVPHDIAERLRVAREQALLRARQRRQAEARLTLPMPVGGATAALGSAPGWWVGIGSLLPLALLLGGLVLIDQLHERAAIRAAAEIDAELLADDLPPVAYHDAGFVEFLRQPEP